MALKLIQVDIDFLGKKDMSKKKKIGVLGLKGLPAYGGAARASECVIDRLKEKYDFTIYSIDTHTNFSGYYNGYFQVIMKGFFGKRLNTLMYYIQSVLHILFWGKFDIIQVNHTSIGFIVPLLRLRFKVIGIARGIVPNDDNKWNIIDKLFFKFSCHLFFKFSNVTISVSEPHIKYFKTYTRNPILYIPNGVGIEPFKNEFDELKGEYLLFSAARIISLKGAHVFLDALNILNYKGKIIIVGSLNHVKGYKQTLLQKVGKLDIYFIDLVKHKNRLYSIIQNAKLFIFPSFNEGMSNILLEVAYLKTPLICSDIPENKSIFNNKEILFFKTGNSFDLAQKIKWALTNQIRMKINAKNAYIKVRKDYNWIKISAKYNKLYSSF